MSRCARKAADNIQCISHDESVAFDCLSGDTQNTTFCFLGSTEVDSKDIDNIEAVRRLCGSRRRSVFGRWLTPKQKRLKLWVANVMFWQHTTGRLSEKKNRLLYTLSNLKWTRTFEMVATISDKGALKFSLFIKDNAVSHESNIYNVNDSVDVKTIIAMFFPSLVRAPISSTTLSLKVKENIDEFFESMRREPVKNWRISTGNIVAVLRPYQEDAIRFMISREDSSQQTTFLVEDDFVELPTVPRILYSPVTGSMSRQIHKPLFAECPPGIFGCLLEKISRGYVRKIVNVIMWSLFYFLNFSSYYEYNIVSCGILADEMGLGKTLEVIGLILSHQRGKGLPPIAQNMAIEVDTVKIIVGELISTVVAATDGYSALKDKMSSRYRRMFCYDNLEFMNPKRCKGNSALKPLTVTCTECSTICSQERVYWDRFCSHDIPFLCPECIHGKGRVYPIRSTLIIAPSTICHQWYEELKRHIRDDIKIDMYRGLVNDGYKHPEYLATQDVVICSFETLRQEVYFVEARPRLDSLRYGKRHHIAPTPLLAVEWWRVCIDEAQMVESTSCSVSLMCDGLKAVNRWCITGTPITNSVQDLYGLVRFLKIEPFCNECWWRNALFNLYKIGIGKPISDLFSKIMWRNTKKTVGYQMLLPSKNSNLTVLRFTPIEEQFYRATLSNCRLRVRYMPCLYGFNTPISSLHGKDFEKLMEPLQALRKFIVFPSLRFQESKANVNTEESLQEELFRISTQQAEVHQRNILMYYCGLAGLEWLCGNVTDAAKYYGGAISAMKDLDQMNHKLGLKGSRCAYRQLRSDKLQQIHIFSAILDLLRSGVEVRGINQKEAEAQLNSASTGYTEQTVSNLTQSYVAVGESFLKYQTTLSKAKSSIGWLSEAISLVNRVGQQHVFIDAVRTALENNGMPSVPASNLLGLNLYVVKRWDELIGCAEKVLSETKNITNNNIMEEKWVVILEAIIACHFSPTNEKSSKNCSLCVCNKNISHLESLLFIRGSKTFKDQNIDETGTAGEQKISSLEIIIRTFMGTLIRMQKGMQCNLVGLGKETVTQLEEFKSLLALSKRLYASANEYAAKIDEIRQCKLRLQYAAADDVTKYGSRLPINLIIQGTENNKRQSDLNALEIEKLKQSRCLAKLRYLSNLRSQRTHDCPICLTTVRDTWIVYPCAHYLCVSCFNRITRRNDTLLVCAVCRAKAYISQISYVQSKASEKNTHLLDVSNVRLKRSVSVKIDAIIRRIKSIRLRDPTSKTLLFTSLSMLINPLCLVLAENNINFRNFLGTNRQKILADFRLKPEIELLVMPMSSGAHGLNLTASNNIIFVEPQMDVSQIAQAIGRIDRIGQKKEMMVHHFVVYGSIEEQIYYKYSQDQNKDWTIQNIVHLLDLKDNNEDLMYEE
ncbi:unnamed protein product [Litomosoides sigmodontis]|uniref:RING-type domain-containing protein n=1 Tax=Litomosoides sigmodontis TaxID=42156 RepID=A0A3P6V3S3_LITSI|nr:unnamed protein product [Litomosoides sigmodontis]